jgi:hypothetical protein
LIASQRSPREVEAVGRCGRVAWAAVLLVLVFAAGCRTTNPYMDEAAELGPLLDPGDRAVVVFLRPKQFLAAARTTTVFDITDGVEMVGIFSNGMKRIYAVPPGERWFMGVLSGRRSLMHATLLPGRIYYVKVFAQQVHPLRPADDEDAIREYWHRSVLVRPGAEAAAWLEANRASVEKHRQRALDRWPTLTAEQKFRYDLRAEDGVEQGIR